jgi:GNAT superfamily N-acetyltransferase
VATDYHIRKATVSDVPALFHHRVGMFTDMGMQFDHRALSAFVPGPATRSRVSCITAGSPGRRTERRRRRQVTLLPWPPAWDLGGRLAFVYNVYTEHAHRRRGIAWRLMEALHAWCRANGIEVVALHASDDGRPLYEKMGYQAANEMRLQL